MGVFDRFLKRDKAAPAPVRPDQSQAAFEQFVSARSMSVTELTAATALTVVIDFYRTVRGADCPLDQDADMLLYQWGVYDWGSGENFEFDLTRQFIDAAEVDGSPMSQLSLKLLFAPSEALRSLERGNRWCHDLGETEEFARFVTDSEAHRIVSGLVPERVELEWCPV